MILQLTENEHYLKQSKDDNSDDLKIRIIENTVLDFVNDRRLGLALDFNVFEWKREELYGLFIGIFVKTGIAKDIHCLQHLLDFAVCMADNYFDNSYHSFNHAIDVTYMCYFLMENMSIAEQLDFSLSDKAVILLSALGHDVLHPGTNNLFQVNSKTDLARKYNNISVLEQQSADFVKQYLEKSPLLDSLDISIAVKNGLSIKQKIIGRICEHILQTDMIYHFGLMEQMIEIADANQPSAIIKSRSGSTSLDIQDNLDDALSNSDDPQLSPKYRMQKSSSCMSMNPLTNIIIPKDIPKERISHAILHAADISNPTRPFTTCKKWADLVLVEFLNQGRLERQANLPISPNMDEKIFNQVESQLSFVEFIVEPLFGCFLELFPRTLSLMDLIADNTRIWSSSIDKKIPVQLDASASLTGHVSRKLSFAAGTIEIPDSVHKNLQGKYRKHLSSTKISTDGSEVQFAQDLGGAGPFADLQEEEE